ncbi:hypothetical protein DET65_3801 [Sunxiuqinia elliptica]|uniref:Uncharacterized protein n=1 Tax=Sunxiuqinia elliptica TaxID=655355 RepID=A0A4R6GYS7_9BACT|nr:hypothetical protein DET52_106237 [Sunxiuqinia elliptica]TDO57216.1 hypothetical protein DET65_3801 [Sunxiuqinia elliptica]
MSITCGYQKIEVPSNTHFFYTFLVLDTFSIQFSITRIQCYMADII